MADSAFRRAALLAAAIVVSSAVGTSFAITVYLILTAILMGYGMEALPDWKAVAIFSGFGLVISLPLTATLGLATHAGLSRLGRRRASSYALSGAAVGAFIGSIYGYSKDAIDSLSGLAVAGALTGASIAICFWLVRRPDHIVAPTQSNTAP